MVAGPARKMIARTPLRRFQSCSGSWTNPTPLLSTRREEVTTSKLPVSSIVPSSISFCSAAYPAAANSGSICCRWHSTLPTSGTSSSSSSAHGPVRTRGKAGQTGQPAAAFPTALSPSRGFLRRRPAEDGKRFVREVQRLGAKGNWRGVLSLLRNAEGDGASMNHIMYNATIAALAKSARWKEAIAVLDAMEVRGIPHDVISFSSAAAACAAAGKADEAYAILLRVMAQWKQGSATVGSTGRGGGNGHGAVTGVKPNTRFFNVVIAALAKQGQHLRALSVLEVDMVDARVTPDIRTWSTLINAFRNGGCSGHQTAELLSKMRNTGLQPDIWCFNLCLNAASQRGEWELVFDLLEDMNTAGVHPDQFSYAAAMKACVNAEEWKVVPVLLDVMMDAGSRAQPNVWHFNLCIDALGKSGEWEKAMDTLRRDMPAAGVKPDIASYGSCLDAARKARQWGVALCLWDEMLATGSSPEVAIVPNEHAYSIIIDVCSKAGFVDRALALLSESREAGFSPTLTMFNATIDACSRAGRWENALRLLRGIGETGLKPDAVSYTSTIVAFRGCQVREHELELALDLIEDMKLSGVTPTNFSHSAAISLCATAGQHERALDLFDELKASGEAPPNEAVFSAVINSCNGGQWKTAMRLLGEMEASGVEPNLAAFNGAIRACCTGGRWHLGHSLLERMRLSGVDPEVSSLNALIRGLRPEAN